MRTCPFCGSASKLTAEHVFGDWLSRIGLPREPMPHGAGPLNRVMRDLGVRPPFLQTVGVCATCNNGWMSHLEKIAQRVLTPFILGRPGQIEPEDTAAIAAWVQKTTLTTMLISSEAQRRDGYGLPTSEYRNLWAARGAAQPLPASQFWIGRYTGQRRIAAAWATPVVVAVSGLPEPDLPQGYAMTVVLGQLILHGLRYTTPTLQVEATTRQDLPLLWPTSGPVVWPVVTEGVSVPGRAGQQCAAFVHRAGISPLVHGLAEPGQVQARRQHRAVTGSGPDRLRGADPATQHRISSATP